MSQNLAQIILKLLTPLISFIHAQPPKRRFALYTAGGLIGAAMLVIDHFMPGWRTVAKHLWISYGPIVLLVVTGLAGAHVALPTASDANYDTGEDPTPSEVPAAPAPTPPATGAASGGSGVETVTSASGVSITGGGGGNGADGTTSDGGGGNGNA